MSDLHYLISQKLNLIDFDKLYPGFKPFDFALYDDKYIYFNNKTIPWNESFIGNTSINYDGKSIAIWNLKYKPDDLDIFTSKIVHEMFHAYQHEEGEVRFPNEFEGLNYDYNSDNLNLKMSEAKYLIMAFNDKSEKSFNIFLSIRKKRLEAFPLNLKYESLAEVSEGTARFIELMVLKQLDNKKYTIELEQLIKSLLEIQNYFPIRKACYNIGALILLTCKELGVELNYLIKDSSQSYLEVLVLNATKPSEIIKIDDRSEIYIDNYFNKYKAKIKKLFESKYQTIEADQLIGLDPMNTVKVDGLYYCTHFVRVLINKKEVNIFGESVIKVESGKITVHVNAKENAL